MKLAFFLSIGMMTSTIAIADTAVDLSPEYFTSTVVAMANRPDRYQPGTASKTSLFELGIVGDISEGYFFLKLTRAISPHKISEKYFGYVSNSCGSTNTVADCAVALESYADRE